MEPLEDTQMGQHRSMPETRDGTLPAVDLVRLDRYIRMSEVDGLTQRLQELRRALEEHLAGRK